MPNASAGTTFRRQTIFVPGALFGRGGGGKKVQHTAVSQDLEKPDAHVSTGTVLVKGTASKTESADSVSAATRAIATASLANTESADTISATGIHYYSVKFNKIESNDGIASQAKIPVSATLNLISGDGVNATGTASAFSWGIIHWQAP